VNKLTLRQRFPSPFSGARWIFWILALTPAIGTVLLVCHPKEGEFFFATVAVALMACVWEAHVRVLLDAKVKGLAMAIPLLARAVANSIFLLLAMMLIEVPVALVMPAYQCYTNRAKTAQLILEGSSLRTAIDDRVRTTRTLNQSGVGLEVKREGRVAAGFVTDAGVIVLVSDEPAAVVMLTPQLASPGTGALQWSCLGYPEKLIPASCKTEATK
jgi:hypothetical protein